MVFSYKILGRTSSRSINNNISETKKGFVSLHGLVHVGLYHNLRQIGLGQRMKMQHGGISPKFSRILSTLHLRFSSLTLHRCDGNLPFCEYYWCTFREFYCNCSHFITTRNLFRSQNQMRTLVDVGEGLCYCESDLSSLTIRISDFLIINGASMIILE